MAASRARATTDVSDFCVRRRAVALAGLATRILYVARGRQKYRTPYSARVLKYVCSCVPVPMIQSYSAYPVCEYIITGMLYFSGSNVDGLSYMSLVIGVGKSGCVSPGEELNSVPRR